MYDAFFFMRQNTTALLNYNDFNDNERASKANAIASMVKEFNERYAAESAAGKGRILLDAKGKPRPLIDVIGTQGHWYMRLNLDAFERTIKTYLDTGVNVDVTELDVAPNLGLDKGQRIQNGPEMNALFLEQGIQYAKLFSLLKEYAAGPGGRHPHLQGGRAPSHLVGDDGPRLSHQRVSVVGSRSTQGSVLGHGEPGAVPHRCRLAGAWCHGDIQVRRRDLQSQDMGRQERSSDARHQRAGQERRTSSSLLTTSPCPPGLPLKA